MKKYEYTARSLENDILDGVYPNGTFLPTEEALMEMFGVSRQTVRNALAVLADKGMIKKRQGSGSVVMWNYPSSSSDKVAVITTYIDDYIFPAQLSGVEEILSRNGYSAVLTATRNKICNERRILEDILKKPVAGILVEGTKTALPNPNIDLYKKIIKQGIPIVFFNSYYPSLQGPLYVCADNHNGGYELVNHLISKGHRSIAGIFKADDIQGHQRYSGYISAMFDAGNIVPDDKTIWYTTETKADLFESDSILTSVGDSTAVVCYNDEIALQLIKYLTLHGKSVPKDIAVVSFDNSSLSEMSPVRITSLSYGENNLGTIAAAKLVRLLHGGEAESEMTPWTLIEKESS